jgi:hypothetical protein
MARLAGQQLPPSDRLANYGPAPWDAVLELITELHESNIDPLLVQYQSALDRLAASIEQVSAVNKRDLFHRAQTATQQAATRWLKSPERARLVSGISRSTDLHLPCWQALFRDNK